MIDKKENLTDLIQFLEASPTAWHAIEVIVKKLKSLHFQELKEGDSWKLKPEGKYFVVRGGSSLACFILPKKNLERACILASHTDSPALKLKPNPEFQKGNLIMLGTEVYGSPLLSSWLNRDLGIAGKIIFLNKKGERESALINLTDSPLVIPQLAPHLDREVNEKGLILNKQEHLPALWSTKPPLNDKKSYLEEEIKKHHPFKQLLSFDLFLYPLEKPRLVGLDQEFISTWRVDSLLSVHAVLVALLNSSKALNSSLKMAIFWDNEEIGSQTPQGAASPFLENILERISLKSGHSREEFLRLIHHSLCLSIDQAHALNPNYLDKHDQRHLIYLNKGIVIKTNAQKRYATDSENASIVQEICLKHKIPFQQFVSRSDLASGSTIGPIASTALGISTVDLGHPQLSMHSTRELAGCHDHQEMCKLLKYMLEREE